MHMSQPESGGTVITQDMIAFAVDQVVAKRNALKNSREVAFHSQLFNSLGLLRIHQISQKDFFEDLMKEGDGKSLSTMAQIDGNDEELPEYYFWLQRTDDQKLLITPQHLIAGPRITVQVGLNEKGELAVEKVKAELLNKKTDKFQEVDGDRIPTSKPGATISRRVVGKGLLRAFIDHAVPFDINVEEGLDPYPVADGDGKPVVVARLRE